MVLRLGQPSDLSVADVANRHESGRTDKIHTMNYEGITIQVYEVVAHRKELLLSVGMRANHPGVLPEIVGKDEGAVRAMLGLPFQTRGQDWDYRGKYESEPGEDVLTVRFKKGRVENAEWNFYLD